jgi:hypothetical protein
VNWVSWSEARKFCESLTASERKGGRCPQDYEYRLPTEAEWEYACRAGTPPTSATPSITIPHRDNSRSSLIEVGASPPNAWGLHEMLGNVAEWCLDEWQPYPQNQQGVTLDRLHAAKGNLSAAMFVVRGGGYWNHGNPCNNFIRWRHADVAGGFRGFRVVLGPERPELAMFDHDRAVALIKAAGGTYVEDETAAGKPLKSVNLADSKITDAQLRHLRSLPSLQSINLTKTNVTDVGVAELQAAMPRLKIIR